MRTSSCGCLVRELLLKKKEKNKSNCFSSKNERLFYYINTRDLFAEIRHRDGNKCCLCNAEVNLHVHHILRKGIYPNYRLTPENLVTLCSNCHLWEAHSGNTNTCNITVARELLSIVFENTKSYTIDPLILSITLNTFKDIL